VAFISKGIGYRGHNKTQHTLGWAERALKDGFGGKKRERESGDRWKWKEKKRECQCAKRKNQERDEMKKKYMFRAGSKPTTSKKQKKNWKN